MILPGTVLEAKEGQEKEMLQNVFLSGGLTLTQVSELTGATTYEIQNWVHRGYCSAPEKKKYTIRHFCRIATINLLRNVLSIAEITSLLSCINGKLDDESDDAIGDDELYFCFVKALNCLRGTELTRERFIIAVDTATTAFLCDHEDVSECLRTVVETVVFAYGADTLLKQAHKKLDSIIG